MFFASWPKSFCADPTAPLTTLTLNFSKTLLAAVSRSRVHIWSGHQHRILLGHYIFENHDVDKYGTTLHAVWSPDSAVIVLATSKGFLHCIRVRSVGHNHTSDSVLHSVNRIVLELDSTIKADEESTGISSLCSDRQYLCVGLSNGSLKRFNFSGSLIDTLSLQTVIADSVVDEKDLPDPATGYALVAMEYCRRLKIYAVVLQDDIVVCFSHPQDPSRRQALSLSRAMVIFVKGARFVCVNAPFLRLAVGCEDGHVGIYSLKTSSLGARDTSMDVSVTLPPYLTDGHPPGAVSCMQWSPKRRSLAVGYSERGIALFSPLGQLTSSSMLAVDTGDHGDAVGSGILALAFGSEGYHLHYITRSEPAILRQLSLIRPVVGARAVTHREVLLLVAEDAVLVGKPQHGNNSDMTFRTVQLPAEYMAEFWPVKCVALSGDGTAIAIAGRRGALVYSIITHKWISFVSGTHPPANRGFLQLTAQSRSIHCSAIAWYRQAVVMVNYDANVQTFEFLAYHKDRLDLDQPLLKHATHCRPLLVDCNTHQLFAYFTDGSFHLYRISHIEDPSSGELLELQLNLLTNIQSPAPINHPIGLALMPHPGTSGNRSRSGSTSSSSKTTAPVISAVILHAGGVATAIDLSTAKEVVVCKAAEALWAGTPSTVTSLTATSNGDALIWCSTEKGLELYQVAPNHTLPKPAHQGEEDAEALAPFLLRLVNLRSRIPEDDRIYPIGFLSNQALLLGLHQTAEHVPGAADMRFSLATKTLSVMHLVLAHYVKFNVAGAQAFVTASRIDPLMLRHSLELLVHIGLENKKDPQELRRVIEFVRTQPDFHEVIIQCARKNEFTFWTELFASAGSPRTLFQQSCNAGEWGTASRYLIIIQNFEGQAVGGKCALQVLQGAIRAGEFELCVDLIAFLRRGTNDDVDDFLSSSTQVHDRAVGKEIDSIINEEIDRLLRHYRIRDIVRLGASLGLPVSDRLGRLWKEGHGRPKSMKFALQSIHEQFCVSLPPILPPGAGGPPPSASCRVHLKQLPTSLQNELEMAMLVTMESECVEWAVVLAMVLFKDDVLHELLPTHPDVAASVSHAVAEPPWTAYRSQLPEG